MARQIVTGAYGFTGKYLADRLLADGQQVHTLTNSPRRDNPFGDRVKASPYYFDQPRRLRDVLQGAHVLYNTYWVRFNADQFTFQKAIKNSKTLLRAARDAGVRRVVHISITNPFTSSDLAYFRGKAEVEDYLQSLDVSHAILRPAVLFGKESILINNIAWALRRLPVFGVFGSGSYRLEPIHVADLAQLAVREGDREEDVIIDAIGPEIYTFRELVAAIGKHIGAPRPVISVPPRLGYLAGWVMGKIMGDVFLTWEEVQGLMQGLLYTGSEPAGERSLNAWLEEHGEWLGRSYASELARRRNRERSYHDL